MQVCFFNPHPTRLLLMLKVAIIIIIIVILNFISAILSLYDSLESYIFINLDFLDLRETSNATYYHSSDDY